MNLTELKEKYGIYCVGQVIRIIDNQEIIVNNGYPEIEEGDILKIYEVSDELFDIDKKSIGYYEHVKENLEVVYCNEQYSICKKIRTTTEAPLDIMSAFSPKTKKEILDLDVYENDVKPLKKPITNVIKIGDLVRK